MPRPALLVALLALAAPAATAQLQPGDLAVVGYHGDDPDAVAFVALAPVPGGTEVALTDNGWQASGQFRANEGVFRYTVPAGGLLPGDVVRLDAPAGIAFSTGGDQALLYQGPDGAPQFVYGLNNEGDGVWQADATSSNTSALPAGLTNGSTAVALFEADNAAYDGPRTGTRGELLQAISDPTNWTTSDSDFLNFPTAFTVTTDGGNVDPFFRTVLPDTQIVVGEAFSFDYDAVDPDGDVLSYSLEGDPMPASATIDPVTGILTWTPTPDQGGTTFDVTVSVSDGVPDGSPDASTTASVTVLTEQPNRPPTFAAALPYGLVREAGTTLTIELPATDADGDALAYAIVSGPEGAAFDGGQFQWTAPDSAAVFAFTLEASDGQASVRRPLFVAVQAPLFEGTNLAETREDIRERFAPERTLGYGPGRDTLYARVEAFPDGVVEGVYTGYRVALPPGVDPSSYLIGRGINAEHTWPQSLGAADEPQRSDMHILYASKENVNAARGNDPYEEIPDAQTQTWYRRTEQRSTVPTDSIDAWSEDADGRFEPREGVKGDIARAIFYFASVYESAAAAGFLEEQLETLLAWNAQDPASADEAVRSGLIQRHQGSPNPFVLDPDLALRAFTDRSSTEPDVDRTSLALSAPQPNPARGTVRLTLTAGGPEPVRVEAFDVLGRRVAVLHDGPVAGQRVPLALDAATLAPGLYVVRASGDGRVATRRVTVSR